MIKLQDKVETYAINCGENYKQLDLFMTKIFIVAYKFMIRDHSRYVCIIIFVL